MRKILAIIFLLACCIHTNATQREYIKKDSKPTKLENGWYFQKKLHELNLDSDLVIYSINLNNFKKHNIKPNVLDKEIVYQALLDQTSDVVRKYKFDSSLGKLAFVLLFDDNTGIALVTSNISKIQQRDYADSDFKATNNIEKEIEKGNPTIQPIIPLRVLLQDAEIWVLSAPKRINLDPRKTNEFKGYLQKHLFNSYIESLVEDSYEELTKYKERRTRIAQEEAARQQAQADASGNKGGTIDCGYVSRDYGLWNYCTSGSCDGLSGDYGVWNLCRTGDAGGLSKNYAVWNYIQNGDPSGFSSNYSAWEGAKQNAGSPADRKRFAIFYLRGYIYRNR